jgi:hypothetical protein
MVIEGPLSTKYAHVTSMRPRRLPTRSVFHNPENTGQVCLLGDSHTRHITLQTHFSIYLPEKLYRDYDYLHTRVSNQYG